MHCGVMLNEKNELWLQFQEGERLDHYWHPLQRREVPRAVISQEQKWG